MKREGEGGRRGRGEGGGGGKEGEGGRRERGEGRGRNDGDEQYKKEYTVLCAVTNVHSSQSTTATHTHIALSN